MESLKGKKTYITGIVAIVSAVGAFLTGELPLTETAHFVLESILAMFIRAGVTTENAK